MAIYSYRARVYWSDADPARIAHFTSIMRLCERAEEEFIVGELGFRPSDVQGVIFPRVRAECDFSSPLFVYDVARVDITGIVIGRSSIRYEYTVYNESRDRLAARCSITVVAYDASRGSSVEVPEALRRALMEAGARLRGEGGVD